MGVVSTLRSFPQVTDMQGLDIGFHPGFTELFVIPGIVNQKEVSNTSPNEKPVRGIFPVERSKVD